MRPNEYPHWQWSEVLVPEVRRMLAAMPTPVFLAAPESEADLVRCLNEARSVAGMRVDVEPVMRNVVVEALDHTITAYALVERYRAAPAEYWWRDQCWRALDRALSLVRAGNAYFGVDPDRDPLLADTLAEQFEL